MGGGGQNGPHPGDGVGALCGGQRRQQAVEDRAHRSAHHRPDEEAGRDDPPRAAASKCGGCRPHFEQDQERQKVEGEIPAQRGSKLGVAVA